MNRDLHSVLGNHPDVAVDARPVVGAIRWDAWSGGEVTRQVEKTLGPLKYQARLPWFAQVSGDRDVRIAGGNQETMDREIAFAVAAGLDYWAFLLYPEGNSMSDHDYHTQTVFPATATPDEIARHLGDACAFVRRHPTLCPANTVILYAWNEHDEGGWLCPTWTPGGKPDASRLHAIAAVLRGEAPHAPSVTTPTHQENRP